MAYQQSTPPDETFSTKSIYLCVNCGEEIGKVRKLYCGNCGTAAGRKELAEENAKATARLNELRAKGEWIFAN